MALSIDPAALAAPISPDEPCGPDLEEAGDLDFLNGLAHAEALLPASFFSRDDEGRLQPFDRSSIDFGRETKALLTLLARTRDVRILALLARFAMLDRDLAGFSGVLTAIATLLETCWAEVHPRGEGGGFELRSAILQALDDVPTVILPLQHVALAQSRRHGAITFRNVIVADGEVAPREDESVPDRAGIERAIEEAEPEALAARRESLSTVAGAVARIGAATLSNGGYGNAVNLERLAGLSGRMRDLLAVAQAPVVAAEDGASDTPEATAAEAAPRPAGRLANVGEASAALAAAGLYLRTEEPSSPAELLVRQARTLVGKSFLEVMRILVPSYAADATIAIGANRGLRLNFEQLSAIPDESAEGEPDTEESAEAAPARTFRAGTRAEAMALIRDVGTFFRSHEPSSPIPLLLEKAAGMADRDFLAILKDVLPDLNAN